MKIRREVLKQQREMEFSVNSVNYFVDSSKDRPDDAPSGWHQFSKWKLWLGIDGPPNSDIRNVSEKRLKDDENVAEAGSRSLT